MSGTEGVEVRSMAAEPKTNTSGGGMAAVSLLKEVEEGMIGDGDCADCAVVR